MAIDVLRLRTRAHSNLIRFRVIVRMDSDLDWCLAATRPHRKCCAILTFVYLLSKHSGTVMRAVMLWYVHLVECHVHCLSLCRKCSVRIALIYCAHMVVGWKMTSAQTAQRLATQNLTKCGKHVVGN